ncbi:nucleotidyltransferase family protein [Daejeonella sp.]|uniref:nucleotidyltransferase family protein n=1 Tax=Daejeonella sp. TaxID=2805397 RepID=UPI0030BB0762
MKYDYKRHLVTRSTSIRDCLTLLNDLAIDAILFVVDEEGKLLGSLTDGDVRRGLINDLGLHDNIDRFIQTHTKCITRGNYTIQQIIKLRDDGFNVIPVISSTGIILNVINFKYIKSYLPIDAVIMAGGRGERLRPLTDEIPKPLLIVGDKAIIKHNLDRLVSFGIDDFWISVRYLGDKIKEFVGNGKNLGIRIKYLDEVDPLGTIGCISLIPEFEHEYILVTNSDILTNLDYEKFFLEFMDSGADFSVATIPYNVNVPYAVLETNENLIASFKEKPTYTYYANAGIYLMKKEICQKIPKNEFYNATDLLENLILDGYKVTSYPLRGYWLDIGKHDDYKKAQDDINFITF